ncbi:MAG: hypothetical protein CL840_01500 [Crocinitomicaceae bacterium]|nr:hypothetical protein [Crocinitomicaceae bacterium]|tara:strand:+ start:2155 stop:3183 length:1029 start_codon:yes stop_codon:yes gene_type:complete
MATRLSFFFIVIFFANAILAQKDSPSKIYLKHYFDMYVPIQKDMWQFSISVAKEDKSEVVEKRRHDLLETLNRYKSIVGVSPNFENDSSLRLAVHTWITTSEDLFKKGYNQIILKKPMAKNSVESMIDYLNSKEQWSTKLEQANENLDNAAEAFANKYSLRIVEEDTRIGVRIKRINEAFRYYDKIYINFFQAYIHEARFNQAVNTQNYDTVKLELDLLKKVTETCLNNVLAIDNFNNDPFLKYAAINILNSYITTSDSYGKQVLEFYKVQSDFNEIKAVVSSKKREDLTPDEISQYNSLVKKRNSLAPAFNENTQLFNHSRKVELREWNLAVEEFISKNAL